LIPPDELTLFAHAVMTFPESPSDAAAGPVQLQIEPSTIGAPVAAPAVDEPVPAEAGILVLVAAAVEAVGAGSVELVVFELDPQALIARAANR
jgi:hypothetical protein